MSDVRAERPVVPRALATACSRGPVSGSLLAHAVALACFLAAPVGHADEASSLCGPFAGPYQVAAADVEAAERAASRSGVTAPAAAGQGGAGEIVNLPANTPGAVAQSAQRESEAVLALPKDGAGQIPTDFELGVGARVSRSFFSPVICATVAKVVGPPGATLEQLVTVVPDTSIVVANDVYATAASELTGLASPPAVPAGGISLPPAAGSIAMLPLAVGGAEAAAQAASANAPGGAPSEAVREADPYAPLQYGLAVSGVLEARHLGAGAGVRVALLDSAPEVGHRDLAATRISAINSDEPVETGVHGTLMAGVIAAVEDNGFGIVGLAPEAELVSVPVCRPKANGGSCTIFDLLQGLDRAWEADAALVNLALSGPANPLLERGVARLEELGLVVVAAAGNEGTREERYPAAYPSVVGVGAIDREGKTFASSNRGPWVELYAPGVEVLSTIPGSAFAFGNGTSLAAAHVTGTLAVLTSVTEDPKRARALLFRAAQAQRAAAGPSLPSACEVLKPSERTCGGSASGD